MFLGENNKFSYHKTRLVASSEFYSNPKNCIIITTGWAILFEVSVFVITVWNQRSTSLVVLVVWKLSSWQTPSLWSHHLQPSLHYCQLVGDGYWSRCVCVRPYPCWESMIHSLFIHTPPRDISRGNTEVLGKNRSSCSAHCHRGVKETHKRLF